MRNRERSREIREKSVRNIEKREERRWVVSCFANVIIFLSEGVRLLSMTNMTFQKTSMTRVQ